MPSKKIKRANIPNRRPVVLSMRGDPAWRNWLDRFARSQDRPVSSVIERALREAAESSDFDEPMPMRNRDSDE